MTSYLAAFGWGICLLMAFAGWGEWVNRVLLPRRDVDWGQKAAWGVGFCVLAGGLLNATSTISRPVLFAGVAFGMALGVVDLIDHRHEIGNSAAPLAARIASNPALLSTVVAVCVLSFVQYAGSVSTERLPTPESSRVFNVHDDLQAYFVFPEKMLQTGSLGADPFSDRRMTTSLGGQAFLHTLVLAALPERYLHLLDPGLGVLIVMAGLIGYLRARDVSPQAAAAVLLLFLLIAAPVINISGLLLGMVMFLSLFRTLSLTRTDRSGFLPYAAVVAVVAAAACSLKSSLIPPCLFLLVSVYASRLALAPVRRAVLAEFATVGILVFIFVLPWMLSMYWSSGTLLFPIFGRGFHASAYGTLRVPVEYLTNLERLDVLRATASSPAFVVLMMLGISAVWFGRAQSTEQSTALAFAVSAGLGMLTLAVMLAGYEPFRFAFPFWMPAILVLVSQLAILHHKGTVGARKSASALAAAALGAGVLVGQSWDVSKVMYSELAANALTGLENRPFITGEERTQYIRMQQSVPRGEAVLARLELPFLLDFRRNRVFIIDWPGAASLPPGMPSFKGPEALAEYLVSKSVTYIAYSYASEAALPKSLFGEWLEPWVNPWIRSLFEHSFDFQENVTRLGRTRRRIYDDGQIFVIDLSKRVG